MISISNLKLQIVNSRMSLMIYIKAKGDKIQLVMERLVFEQDEDYYEDLPYLFYGSEFVTFIVECANNGNEGIMKKAFEIVEELMKNGDEKVVNLVEVAVVVGSIFLDSTISNKKIIEEYFGALTKKSYKACTK